MEVVKTMYDERDDIIKALVTLLSEIDTHKNPVELFRKGGIGGQDQYAGMSPFKRSYSILMSKYHKTINQIFKNNIDY